MKVLVIGGGGREHALVWKMAQSPKVEKIFVAPGNGGTRDFAENVPIGANEVEELLTFAREKKIDLTVVGPEEPLLLGIVDRFEEEGLPIYGPNRRAALIEGSKSFAKGLMKKYGIPTARYEEFTSYEEAAEALREAHYPLVLKADGLAAGKGVVIVRSQAEAEKALREMMVDRIFGKAGEKIVIEEFLEGEEVTLLAFVDGKTVLPMEEAQDHKPVFDGNRGPNTGGMGAYSPVPHLPSGWKEMAYRTILFPIVEAMWREGIHYRGVLYAGLMLTQEGPKVIEFNCRFGDPEAQVILPRLENDLLEIMEKSLEGRLHEVTLTWKEEACLTVILTSPGYPGAYPKGLPISMKGELSPELLLFHAGTKEEAGRLVTAGGRVLAVTALGSTIYEAREKAYREVGKIDFEGMHYRTDIGLKG
ncbi:phosphoribosylglycinamide synthetase [[Clostridium] ultunense Esp]|uniref:phosphoribosylamine--glycine ligase n=1 Tax=Thermicanus aegyptius TaxID=94009 RepID=UPI0002B70299|nr:phosphoribosylamine--glycine ligase [Thermicanus aegyptius]CCQ93114.1 phosphoribosylglycinamide synthetase [[Clostridium] ultunense Esp]